VGRYGLHSSVSEQEPLEDSREQCNELSGCIKIGKFKSKLVIGSFSRTQFHGVTVWLKIYATGTSDSRNTVSDLWYGLWKFDTSLPLCRKTLNVCSMLESN
jgi:hypothetical protein